MTHEDLVTLFDRALRQRDIHDLIAVAKTDPECYVARRDWYTRRDPREVAYEVVDLRTNTSYEVGQRAREGDVEYVLVREHYQPGYAVVAGPLVRAAPSSCVLCHATITPGTEVVVVYDDYPRIADMHLSCYKSLWQSKGEGRAH